MGRYLGLNPLQWTVTAIHLFVFIVIVSRLSCHKIRLIEALGGLGWVAINLTFYTVLALWHMDYIVIKAATVNLWSTVLRLFNTAYLALVLAYTTSGNGALKEAVNGAISKVS